MSPETARDLSIQDILRVLNEKLSLGWARIREISPSCTVSAAELESEVSTSPGSYSSRRDGVV